MLHRVLSQKVVMSNPSMLVRHFASKSKKEEKVKMQSLREAFINKLKDWGLDSLKKAYDDNLKVKFSKGQVEASITKGEKLKRLCLRFFYGEKGLTGAQGEADIGNLKAVATYGDGSKSPFDPNYGVAAMLKARSNFVGDNGAEIKVVEMLSGLYYFVPFAGIPKEAVTGIIKGRWLKLSGSAPEKKPGGTAKLDVELFLPEPINDEYQSADYTIRWYHNEAVVRVVNYKNRVAKVKMGDEDQNDNSGDGVKKELDEIKFFDV